MELINTLQEYIALLEKACGEMTVFCSVHGMNASEEDIKKGEELRAKIKSLTN